tara:strand:- start:457 stop:1074 length:618 start_codon:yes stop_codon:yes gene_type:complete
MEHYFSYDYKEFVILGGEKVEYIYDFFKKNFNVVDQKNFIFDVNNSFSVQVLDTGQNTMTGGRIKKAIQLLELDQFMLTYGDGISNVDIKKLEEFSKSKGTIATVTGVKPPARFGNLKISGDFVDSFNEKTIRHDEYVNGGYFVMKSDIANFIEDENTSLEKEPMEILSKNRQLSVYKHNGYFQPIDTIREKEIVEEYLINKKND